MSAQVYSVPGQTEGRRKALLGWKSIDLSYELSLTCGSNVNNHKSVHHPIPTRENREHSGNFQNKSVSSAFNWKSRYILFLAKLKGRGRPFFGGYKNGGDIVRLPLGALGCDKRWKTYVSPFVKFKIILPLLCFLLDALTNKHSRTWNSVINLSIDS